MQAGGIKAILDYNGMWVLFQVINGELRIYQMRKTLPKDEDFKLVITNKKKKIPRRFVRIKEKPDYTNVQDFYNGEFVYVSNCLKKEDSYVILNVERVIRGCLPSLNKAGYKYNRFS